MRDTATNHGDMSRPKDNGSAHQLTGNMYVLAGSIREPGVVGFMTPSSSRMATTESKG